ncbi:hypothetical protein [Dyella caseinilytica]|uniref:Uncharacterized protein n=1 Tax=Dyella caseinilytica TaxID=1849581 RepID=A0ABX7GYB1_9GAMM|nr:hypothetical protein [Dyella caseinilytica]QRN55495.1 hypothetical protein ISN74_09320 [Dyella caseinilytica]
MPRLRNFPCEKQESLFSSWACAAREIINWYDTLAQSNGQSYASDEALAQAWMTLTWNLCNGSIYQQQSAAAALSELGFPSMVDDHPLPTPNEIIIAIDSNEPLLATVGDADPGGAPNCDFQDCRWVVIVGIEEGEGAGEFVLQVFDPQDGQIHEVLYDAAEYQTDVYWQSTSYVDPYDPAPR